MIIDWRIYLRSGHEFHAVINSSAAISATQTANVSPRFAGYATREGKLVAIAIPPNTIDPKFKSSLSIGVGRTNHTATRSKRLDRTKYLPLLPITRPNESKS